MANVLPSGLSAFFKTRSKEKLERFRMWTIQLWLFPKSSITRWTVGIFLKGLSNTTFPMTRGAVCSSIWKIMEFNTEKELKIYEFLIPRAYSYYGEYEIKKFKTLASYNGNEQCIVFASQGDTHASICGMPPSKGPQQVCAHCEYMFYMSDKHYFDDDHQLEYCGWRCHAMANGILP